MIETESPALVRAAVSGARTTSVRPPPASSVPASTPSSRTIPVNMPERYGSLRYACRSTSSPIGRASRRESSSGRGSPSSMPGPSPESLGATNTSSLSTSSASRNAAASVGTAFEEERLDAFRGQLLELLAQRARVQLELRALGKRPAAERDPARLPDHRDVARIEPRVVPANGAHADRDGVGLRSQDVDELPGRLARDPALARHADAPVERDRDLVRDERPARGRPRPPLLDLLAAAERELARRRARPRRRPRGASRGRLHASDRIALTRDHARDAGLEQRVDARRRRAVVRARLEGHVHRGAARLLARGFERDDLRVRPALALVPALADDLVSGDHDGADDRVRMGRPAPALGELERSLQEPWLHAADPTVGPYAARDAAPPRPRRDVEPRARLARRAASPGRRLRGQWSLELESPFDTPHSLVVPAGDVVLKLNAPSHVEADARPMRSSTGTASGAVDATARARRADAARRGALLVEDDCLPGRAAARSGRGGLVAAPRSKATPSASPSRGSSWGEAAATRATPSEAGSRSNARCSTSPSTSTARSTDRRAAS